MGNENTLYRDTQDTTVELAKLLESGLNENQIARMVRLRATYNHTSDELPPVAFTKDEEGHLAFLRWLHQTGRVIS